MAKVLVVYCTAKITVDEYECEHIFPYTLCNQQSALANNKYVPYNFHLSKYHRPKTPSTAAACRKPAARDIRSATYSPAAPLNCGPSSSCLCASPALRSGCSSLCSTTSCSQWGAADRTAMRSARETFASVASTRMRPVSTHRGIGCAISVLQSRQCLKFRHSATVTWSSIATSGVPANRSCPMVVSSCKRPYRTSSSRTLVCSRDRATMSTIARLRCAAFRIRPSLWRDATMWTPIFMWVYLWSVRNVIIINTGQVSNDGYVYVGRGWEIQNVYSNSSVAVCFMGDYLRYQPSSRQLEGVQYLLEFGITQKYLRPDYLLVAHNQVHLNRSIRRIACGNRVFVVVVVVVQTAKTSSPGVYVYREIVKWPHWYSGCGVNELPLCEWWTLISHHPVYTTHIQLCYVANKLIGNVCRLGKHRWRWHFD